MLSIPNCLRVCFHRSHFELQIQVNLKIKGMANETVWFSHTKTFFGLDSFKKYPSKGFADLTRLCHNLKIFKLGEMLAAGETMTNFGHREDAFIHFYFLQSGLLHKNEMNHSLLVPCRASSGHGPKLCSSCVQEWDPLVSTGKMGLSGRENITRAGI